jgi:hypothetical protein
VRAGSVLKPSFTDVDINQLTGEDVQNLMLLIGIGMNGDVDEKWLEARYHNKLE